jgi:IS30 family transposase
MVERGKLPNRVSIEERPAIVKQRQQISDWELDTFVAKGHHLGIITLTERKSRFSLLSKVKRCATDQVSVALIDLLLPVSDHLHSLTADNGKEFAEYERVAHELQTDFFFVHPFTAWEGGTNENMNGLVRLSIPKKWYFASVPTQYRHGS